MKKFIIYALTALAAVPFVSCKDEIELGQIDVNDLDRIPMTLFRVEENTGKNETETYGCHCVTEQRNTIYLSWYGIEGAYGYEVRYGLRTGLTETEYWNDPAKILEDIIIADPNQLDLYIRNLEYSTNYGFSIRTLSPKGVVNGVVDKDSPYHSKWYGIGDQRQWADYYQCQTEERYPTPGITNFKDKDYNQFTVVFDLAYDHSGDNEQNDFIGTHGTWDRQHFFVDENGNYIVHTLVVKPSPTNPNAECPAKWNNYKLTAEDLAKGEVVIDGLSPNSVYVFYLVNDNIDVPVDAMYNQGTVRTKGDPGEPIYIHHSTAAPDRNYPGFFIDGQFSQETYDKAVEIHKASVEYDACRIDTVISNYTTNINLAEGQTFYLDGDKAYFFDGNPTLCKGFIMETNPEDLAQGKRAKVYMSGIRKEGTSVQSGNFMFGRPKESGEADAPIAVENIEFRHIDFDCPLADNFGSGAAQGNYFANMYSNGMAVTFDSFKVIDCTFQRMIRGFIRVQGSKVKVFKNITVDGCAFYNNGYYDNNGRGYAWFAGDGASAQSNIYNDVVFTNNTIYDSPRTCLFTDNGKDLAWGDDVSYHFTFKNNTLINFSTRSTGRYIFDLRFLPNGSTITCEDNLFVLAAADNDARSLNFGGMDVRTINGAGNVRMDIRNNWQLGCREEHYKADGIFNGNAFSAKKNSAGAYVDLAAPWGVTYGEDELPLKYDPNFCKATDLFTNPNPPYTAHNPTAPTADDHKAPNDFWGALKYKVLSGNPIVDQKVGDQRWTSSDPRTYYHNK